MQGLDILTTMPVALKTTQNHFPMNVAALPPLTYEKPILTVDVAALRLHGGQLQVALLPRAEAPFAGKLALVGGFVHTDKDENTDATALRVLSHKLRFRPSHMEQVATISGAQRDPRGWSASVVYLALLNDEKACELNQVEDKLVWANVDEPLPELAFDHQVLVTAAVYRLRSKAQYSSIAAHLLGATFTMPELHAVYERVLQRKLDRANFRRKALEMGGFRALGVLSEEGVVGRPGVCYQLDPGLTYVVRGLA